jgi:cysteine desulfurase
MKEIYLDHNATTPVDGEVADAMKPYLDDLYGNPSSTHSFGIKTKIAVETARQQLASLLKCDSSEIIFTSGGTEANNMAVKGVAMANREKGRHIITSSIEHPSIYEVCRFLEREGFRITWLPVDSFGMVNPLDVESAISGDTILITIMHANNEVGTIQPIKEIAKIARKHSIIFHTDAAQSVGKVDTNTSTLGIDLMSIAGHKLYAPKGIGALYLKKGIQLEKLMHGADHEQNLRAGTENVLALVGLGKACELSEKNLEYYSSQYTNTRDRLWEILSKELPDVKLNGHPELRLPNTLSISFPGVEANTLISRLEGVAASAGAACHAESIDVSAVLEAMHTPIDYAMGTIRFSTGRTNTIADIEIAAKEIITKVRSLMPGDANYSQSKEIIGDEIKLTRYTHGLGCACKIEPQKLEKVLDTLKLIDDVNILVGTETSDDATVYSLSDSMALVQTLDFFTPIVDSPYHFGAIAAANALSDIYAMGARPIFALNIVGFPEKTLPMKVLEDILRGANDKAHEAGINVLGGHTIEDPEPKYGMVVSGLVHPEKIIKNHGLNVGDSLILTKPLGTGILTTAMKRGLVDVSLSDELIELMSQLNRTAAETMANYKVSACTDVTGFGLLGHLREMSIASGCDIDLNFESIPFIKKARDFVVAGLVPGGTHSNLDWVSNDVDFGNFTRTDKLLLCDAQTSGGLLIAVAEKDALKMLNDLRDRGIDSASVIGNVTSVGPGKIRIS